MGNKVIKYLLFDLDNTLYSTRYGLEDNVSFRIRKFTSALLGITPEEVREIRKANIRQYGTCLEWLMAEKGFTDIETYLSIIHPKDEAASLPRDDKLSALLANIPIPKAILTNSPREHADLILDKLGVTDLFTHIFDIRQCGFKGKPQKEVFDHAINSLGVRFPDVLFIDDNPHNIEVFISFGGNGLLFDENNIHVNCLLPRIRDLIQIVEYLE
ncbi:MAG: HAD-IA family hydrolase [Treponema sp.]|jgi:putative hydrolase of the HAD superfamily|nr:HAD-IA family hydrolase [Treponema sp.]